MQVRALHLVAQIEQHLGDAAHAAAADADQVDEVDAAHAIVHAGLASRRHAQIREARRRVDVAGGARRLRHLEQPRAIRGELGEVRAQALGRQLALRQHPAGADAHHDLGVLRLMIVGGGRKRHQECAESGGLQLGDGHGAGPAQGQIRPGIGRRHVVDEGQHLGLDRELPIRGARRLDTPLARLVPHLRAARRIEARQRLRHGGVQALRTLAAAEHQETRAPRAAGEARRRARADAAMSARTGLPTVRAFTPAPKLPGNASSTCVAKRASQRLVKPAIAFCSWINSGMRSSHAAMPPGPLT